MATAIATIPQVNLITDHLGSPVLVQLSLQEWTSFVEEQKPWIIPND